VRKSNVSILSLFVFAVLTTVLCVSSKANGQDRGIINQQPLDDFVADVNSRVRSGQLDLSQAFTLDYDFFLYSDGRFDSQRSKLVKSTGDAKLTDAARAGVLALAESGYFSYLSSLGVDRGRISFVQKDRNFSFVLTGDAKSPRQAQTVASGLKSYVFLGRSQVQNVTDRLILDNIKVNQNGSNVIIDFSVSISDLQRLTVG
jgi:hypothetical protein